ncbi:MAG: DUF5110 domain-containing protein [Phycisphaerae bacterium]|nr:DUF5110 domain-containing protein [Phycisphaerae bacterium]
MSTRQWVVGMGVLVLAALCGSGARAQPAESLGPGIVRFFPPGLSAETALPSFALKPGVKPSGAAPGVFPITPAFGTDDKGRFTATVAIEAGTSLYGTGEVSGPLLRNGRTVVAWNTDAYGYKDDTRSLYQSHPWVLAVRANGSAFGVLADTTWRCEMNLVSGIAFAGEGAPYPVIVIDGPSPQDVLKSLARLIGTIELPPLWALGYHQCRYSYVPAARVREVASEFRARAMPCDVIWFDIDYMKGYRVFTFDAERFPDPAGLNADLRARGFHTIWMIDPGVKAEAGYPVFDSGSASDHWVKDAKGQPYRGEVWPGMCSFPDYTDDRTRAWWAGLYRDFMARGIDGVWNDMNEPAVFGVESKTMPEDNRHRGGEFEGRAVTPGPHARFHNVYGMLMAKGTLDGIRAANPSTRPFVLTRANYIGGHRYAATWTGDNSSEWYDLEVSVPMILNLGLSGQPFAGPDIGGFIGNGNPEMFSRWMGVGSLFPFCRGHTAKGNRNKEPFAWGDETEAACRLALQRRYRLIPYFYTLFRESSISGLPVMRPAFFADPRDPALRSEDDAFLLGSDVVVVPSLTPGRERVPVTPEGNWRVFTLVGEGAHKDLPELRLRGGAILPLGPVEEFTGQRPLDPLTLLVALDDSGRAEGTLYEDAGEGFDYREGQYLLSTYRAVRDGTLVTVSLAATEGKMPRADRRIEVQVLSNGMVFTGTGRDGSSVTIDLNR